MPKSFSEVLIDIARYTFLMQNYRYVAAIDVHTVSYLTTSGGLMTVSTSSAFRVERTPLALWLVSRSRSLTLHSYSLTLASRIGMLHKVGLLPQFNNEQVPFAYKIFNRSDKAGWELSEKFKKTFTAYVLIIF